MIPALVALVLLPVLAYQFLPSFRHRMGFVRYDFGYYSKMEYREGSSDGFRYYSLLSGCDHFTQQPPTGVGFRGLHIANRNWFKAHFPQIREDDHPAQQWICTTCCGCRLPDFWYLWLLLCSLWACSIYEKNGWFMAIYASITITWLFRNPARKSIWNFYHRLFLALAWWMAEGNEKIL